MWLKFIKPYKKKIKGREYWYIQKAIKTSSKHKTIGVFVAPTSTPKNELKKIVPLATQKMLNKINELELSEANNFVCNHLTSNQVKKLANLRFSYNYLFKQSYPIEYKKYEESVFVKYVHGTTAIEGNTLSLEQTKLVLEEGLSVTGKSLREVYEVENYKRTKKIIKKNKEFTPNLIKKIHKELCNNLFYCNPGQYRRIEVGISGTNIDTTPPAVIETELEHLFKWYQLELKKNRHVLEIACEFHQRFEEIHPFIDGNGRVGRELINYLLEKHNYPLVYLEPSDREEYLNALKEGNKSNPKPLIELYYKKLVTNHQKVLESIKKNKN